MSKKRYEAPKLMVYGRIVEITKETGSGSRLDANFNAGTHFNDLGWS